MGLTRLLLLCGVAATVLYAGMDIVAGALFYPGYDFTTQQVSELSAIGAPSRDFWMAMSYPFALLLLAFAAGVWSTGAGKMSLRIAAVLIALFAANALAWGWLAPMHMRNTEFTGTDTMHLVFAVSAIVLILAFIGFGAAALGRGFRLYSAITLVLMLGAGAWVGTQVAAIAAGGPTPGAGLVERLSVHGPMLWLAVFALALLPLTRQHPTG